jgi:hypothetical protein
VEKILSRDADEKSFWELNIFSDDEKLGIKKSF